MDTSSSSDVFLFEEYRLDPRGGLSRRTENGEFLQVSLGSRALAVLAVLVERAGDLVSKDEIMRAAWPGTTVEDANLTMQISSLRRALDAGRAGSSCILNVPGRGYRFLPEVRRAAHPREPSAVSIVQPAPSPRWLGQRHVVVAAMFSVAPLVLVGFASGVFRPLTASRPAAYSSEDRRLSLIVLPFENSSGDPAQDGVAAGITRDVTDQLAKNPYTPLIPAATAAIYRGKTIDLHKIGRDHKVHFALTGNARRQDGRLIVSAALYETDNDRPIWSLQFDRADSSDQRKSIVHHITDGSRQAATDAEVARAMREHPNSLDKRDLLLAAGTSSLYANTKKNYLAVLSLLDRALALDPDYVPALTIKAQYRAQLVDDGFSSDPAADLDIAIKAADRALLLAPNDVNVLRRKARVLHAQGKLDEAAALIRRVIELDPLDGWRFWELGQIQMIQGRFKDALENYVTAKQLIEETSPVIDRNLANALLANDRFPEAIAAAQLAIGESPPEGGYPAELQWLALIAAESENGQTAQARADLQKFLATPRTIGSIAGLQKAPHWWANPKLLEGLRQAGMPE